MSSKHAASRIEEARQMLNEHPVAVEGEDGNKTTFSAACKLAKLNLTEEDAWPLMKEYNEERAEPPWEENELLKLFESAFRRVKDDTSKWLENLDEENSCDSQKAGAEHVQAVAKHFTASVEKPDWSNAGDSLNGVLFHNEGVVFMCRLFESHEIVNVVKVAKDDSKPSGYGISKRVKEWTKDEGVLGPELPYLVPHPKAGAWIRINPMDGKGVADSNVTEFRYVLVEGDKLDVEMQSLILRRLYELGLPIVSVTDSGGKSLHALIRVDCESLDDYRKLTSRLLAALAPLGVDDKNKNPSRLSRLPGVMRGKKYQRLLFVESASEIEPLSSKKLEKIERAVSESVKVSASRSHKSGLNLAPLPLPVSLPPVPNFNAERLLPSGLRKYVQDGAKRLQVDGSFIAVPLLVAFGSVVGNRIGIRPRRYDSWTEFPNMWGGIVGRPGALKSPSLRMALRPLHKLEKAANLNHREEFNAWKQKAAVDAVRRQAAKARAMKAASKDQHFDPAELMVGEEAKEPACRRFICNDATPEALHAILANEVNASGVLLFNDELSGLLARLNDRDRGGALRAFMLSAWSGNMAAVVDRVGRGENMRVDRCCVSVLGGIQPGKIAPLVAGAVEESVEDDGWLQRLSLLVYPDLPEDFEMVDALPDSEALSEVTQLFERVEETRGCDFPGAAYDEDAGEWFLRLDAKAAAHFKEWMETEMREIRSGKYNPAIESHFIKHRKTACGLALLFHLACEWDNETVSLACLKRALAWCDYLKAHALRIYGSGNNATAVVAKRIGERLKQGDLKTPFTARDIKQKDWSGLTDSGAVNAGLSMLVEFGWLEKSESKNATGRPSCAYTAHPDILKRS